MTKVTNYMEGCFSNELVPENYYRKVISLMCVNYGQVREMGFHQEFVNKVALNNLIEILVKLDINLFEFDHLLPDILSSIYRQQYIIAFIKHGKYLSSITNGLSERDLVKVDQALIQSKHPNFSLATSLIEAISKQTSLSLPFLIRVLAVWSS